MARRHAAPTGTSASALNAARIDARGGGELGATLTAVLREQAGLAVAFGDLAAPDASG